jgi:hypothetical protein
MRCQAIHSRRVTAGGGTVIDPTHNERAAMETVLPVLGEYVASIGNCVSRVSPLELSRLV